MDPVTLKMVLQLAQVLGRSKLLRRLVVGLVLTALVGTGATIYGSLSAATQLAASFGARQQSCVAPPEQLEGVSTGAGAKTTTADEKAVWEALRAAGFDAVHAAGAMGNMQAESGFDPQIEQGGRHTTRRADAGSVG